VFVLFLVVFAFLESNKILLMVVRTINIFVRVLYPEYHGPLVMAQQIWIQPSVANGWGTKYSIPEIVPPQLTKGGPPT
jgi:hypothetical protein